MAGTGLSAVVPSIGNGVECCLQVKHAKELRKDHQTIVPTDVTDKELFKRAGRYVHAVR